jgi:uncharacterized membrane protein YjdF
VTLGALVQPGALLALVVWNFAVLSAAQLTIRLIMAYSARLTLVAAVALTVADLPIAAVFDAVVRPQPSLAARLELAPLAMLLTGLAGFAIARWLLRIRRLRGQIVAAFMVGLLDPHLFTLLFP